MVRANGQRDGVGKTSQLSGAFEHTGAILDPTRVSPYRPAADEVPHPMRPDTRQRLTARTNHPKDRCAVRPSLRSEPSTSRTVNRGCQAATRLLHFVAALRVTAAADRAESPCGPAERLALVQREQARDLGAPLRCRGQPLRQPRRTDVQNAEPQKKACNRRGVHTRTVVADQFPEGYRLALRVGGAGAHLAGAGADGARGRDGRVKEPNARGEHDDQENPAPHFSSSKPSKTRLHCLTAFGTPVTPPCGGGRGS